MKKIILLFAFLGSCLVSFAQTFTSAGVNFSITSPSTVQVSLNPNFMGAINVPTNVSYLGTNFLVTGIGANAFKDCEGLTSIAIPNSVTRIEERAFENCSMLASLFMPNSINSIGELAFADCTSLVSVRFPSSLTSQGSGMFFGCTSLASVTIPNTITSIGNGAFQSCTSLQFVTIPSSVTSIGVSAFLSCTSLNNIIIPNSVTSIGATSFSLCESLTSITIPNTITRIEESTFRYCSNLNFVNISNSIVSIEQFAFHGCTSLISINIPNSVTRIGYNAFSDCSILASIVLPNSLAVIEENTFTNCGLLSSVTIPSAITSIASMAFSGCLSLTSININKAVPISISSDVFLGVPIETATLFVPFGKVLTYQGAAVWNGFNAILPNSEINVTQLANASCGTTLPIISAMIYATPKLGVTGYRFEVTNLTTTTTTTVQIKDKPLQFFKLTELVNHDYATAYSVRVMLKVGATWLGYYGNACTVTTPGLGSPIQSTLTVMNPVSGSTITSSATIYATTISGATGYRFRVKTHGQPTYIVDRTLQFFAFNSLPTFVYGAIYTVEVAVKTTGGYTPFGTVCTFFTFAPRLVDATCGATIPANGVVYAITLPNVTSYVFTVKNANTNTTFAPIVRSLQFLPVNLIPGYTPTNQYNISVVTVTTGQQSENYLICVINNSQSSARISALNEKIYFNPTGYPNPFADNFTLEITSNTSKNNCMQVYDMLGNRVEVLTVLASDLKTIKFGNNYASGVYNIVVSQGETSKSIRMIKQ